ncbi:MAG: hypothetical protein JXJ22_16435 [Bacteroidales bacterium]|nr:hypothetical protein [Bacteroidales bacterium]
MDNNIVEKHWKLFYKIGAISVFLSVLVMLTEIFLTALPDGARAELTIEQLFDMYNRNWFMAMRYMGLINIIASTLMLPVFFSLYGLYRYNLKVFASFSLILSFVGYVIFMADNASFACLGLAEKYFKEVSDINKTILLAAGEALFAKGASHTPGTFPGFLIGEIAGIFFSIIMLIGRVLKKSTGIIGLIGCSFLLIFEVISSFISSLFYEAMIFAMIGGIMTLVWYVLIGLGLLKNSR